MEIYIYWRSEKRRNVESSPNVKELGQYSHNKVLKLYKLASIAIAPSKWDEPLGRLPIEAACKWLYYYFK